jgi:hypothetical protein
MERALKKKASGKYRRLFCIRIPNYTFAVLTVLIIRAATL